MNSFWSGWIIFIALVNIIGCVWLIWWAGRPRKDEAAKGAVTGHVWDDDLEELNNPMPRWWLWLFYISIVFSLFYIAAYPGFGSYKGVLNWSQESQYEEEIKQANSLYGPIFASYSKLSVESLSGDNLAMDSGRRLFLNSCATCHGSDARGSKGYPNLTDRDWLYGGESAQIKTSIADGRRAVMPAFSYMGEEAMIEVSEYVLSLSQREVDESKIVAGKIIFQQHCIACHGENAKGNVYIGAPNLTDKKWLYGENKQDIITTIRKGRQGVMPAHKTLLGEDKVHLLTAYVYSLSNQ